MTVPDERTRAVQYARRFLRALIHPAYWKEVYGDALPWPRTPKIIREQARRLMKHYPTRIDLDRAHEAEPTIWGAPGKDEDGG